MPAAIVPATGVPLSISWPVLTTVVPLACVLSAALGLTLGTVFAAWTDPESLKQWFAPRPYTIPQCEVDLRPGGGFRTVMNDPDGNQMFDSTGCYLDIVPNERLVWTSALTTGYRPQPDEMPFTAILELEPNGSGGCTYRAIAIHQDPAGRKQHEEMGFHEGWGTVVDQLVEHLQSSD